MESAESTLFMIFVTKGSELLVLRSSWMLSFPREHQVGIRRLLWLRASAHCFIHTNEECSTKSSDFKETNDTFLKIPGLLIE